MEYSLIFSQQAKEEVSFFTNSGNKTALKKLDMLLNELIQHPFSGTGKPERLKHELTDCWSRRINQEHRLVYQVEGNEIYILSVKGHY